MVWHFITCNVHVLEREDQVSRKLEFIREIYCYYRNIVEIAHDKSDESPIKKEFRRSYQLDIRVLKALASI